MGESPGISAMMLGSESVSKFQVSCNVALNVNLNPILVFHCQNIEVEVFPCYFAIKN